jgi:transcriptional regulator with XRE-family HTH domain
MTSPSRIILPLARAKLKESPVGIGDRIRTARKAANLTQEELARLAEVNLNVITRLERGASRDPHISTLHRIAHALGVSVDELLGEQALAGKAEAQRETGQPRITDLVMDAVRNTDEKDWQAIHRAQESEKLQISIPSVENAAIEHLAERDKGELIDGLFELAKSKLKEEQENARLREALEGVTQLREADR